MIVAILIAAVIFVIVFAGTIIKNKTDEDLMHIAEKNAAKIEKVTGTVDAAANPVMGSLKSMYASGNDGFQTEISTITGGGMTAGRKRRRVSDADDPLPAGLQQGVPGDGHLFHAGFLCQKG